MEDMCVTQLALHIAATTPLTELHSSIIVMTTLERAFNLDICTICLGLSKDGERRTECRRVNFATPPSRSFGKRWRSFL